jgi:hypothetical protein
MLIMKRHNPGIRPEHGVIAEFVRPVWILRIRRRKERHIVGLRMRPTLLESSVPEGKVFQPEDLPHAALLDVLVLIDAALPPLYQSTWVRVFDALVSAGRHHTPKTPLGACTLGVHIDDALDLRVVKEEAVDRPVTPVHEGFSEAADVKASDTIFAVVATAEELNARVGMIRVELSNLYFVNEILRTSNWVYYLLVETLVEVVAVFVLELSDLFLV